ncbi:MAG: response regulator transcription factor [Roseovarius sp.]|nr:response regulator transcription factor [Roseovarius sp.]
MHKTTALILEDDPDTHGQIAGKLADEGVTTVSCVEPHRVLTDVSDHAVDICFIGSELAARDSLDVVRDLRQNTAAGVLVLGHSNDEVDIVLALEMGADDYVAKPLRLRETCARARAVLRRTLALRADHGVPRPLPDSYLRRVGNLEICGVMRSVSRNGEEVELTAMEFDVLLALAARTNAVLSREKILETVRGKDWAASDRAIDGVISRLRRKLFADGAGPLAIKTVHGRGYMLVDLSDDGPAGGDGGGIH